MTVLLSPVGGVAGQFFDNNGNPLTGGKIYTYAAGTTTPQATYTTISGTVAHSNPIILDAGGRVPSGEIWLTDGYSYKFLLKNATDVLIGTYDNIVGINSNFVNFLATEEIQTATASQTVFTLATTSYQPGTNSLSVFVDGVNQYDGSSYAYVETNSTTVTFTAGLHVGALVKFTTVQTQSAGATDASQVSYTPAGTGAVATTVQAKLRESVSVLDFGADPTGATNSATAINSAIVAAAGKCIYIPSGVYKCNSPILFQTSNTELIGDGASTVLWGNHSGIVLEVSPTSGLLSSITVSQLVCWSPTGAGFQASQTINSTFADLWAYSSNIGFTLVNQVQGCTLDRLIFSSNIAAAFIARYPVLPAVASTDAGIFLSNAGTECNANVFNAPIVEGAGSHGISVWGLNTGITLINPLSEGNGGYGFTFEGLTGTAGALKVIGAYAEANTLGAAYIQGQSLMSLENCWFGAAAGSTVTMVLVSNSSIKNSICYSVTEDATSLANTYDNFSFVTTFSRLGWRYTLTPSNATSPYIQNFGTQFVTNNTGPTTMAGFTGGYIGETIVVYINDANTTINFTSATFKGNNGSNWSPIIGDWMTCTYNGTYWLCSVNNT